MRLEPCVYNMQADFPARNQQPHTVILALGKSLPTPSSLFPKNSSISHLTSTNLPANHSLSSPVRKSTLYITNWAIAKSWL